MIYAAIIINLAVGFILPYIFNIISCKIKGTAVQQNLSYNLLIIVLSIFVTVLCYFKFKNSPVFIKAVFFGYILILVSFIDISYRIIPDGLIIFMSAFGVLFLFTHHVTAVSAGLGAAAGGGIMLLMALIPNAIGGGDVKLMLASGLFLGAGRILTALIIAFISAAAFSLILIAFKKKGRKDYIPFAPFLALGSFAALLLI